MRKYQWMGISAIVLSIFLLADSIMALATEEGVIVGDGITETEESYEIDEDEIWALIDKSELRSLIDVEALKEQIDQDALKETIDKIALLETINDTNLLASLGEEEILAEYNEIKESGELEAFLDNASSVKTMLVKTQPVADEEIKYDEEFIENHPIDVPNIKIPIISEGSSPFDYIVDPRGLVYSTNAARYDGGIVKEGATVLFENADGDYRFSDVSDMLEIVNKSNVPLQVTIKTSIEGAGSVKMAESMSELGGSTPSLFMALVDDEGIISVLSEKGNSETVVVLNPVPEGTYVYTWDPDKETYVSEMSKDADESTFDSFEFGLKAACNTEADWSRVDSLPTVAVSWKAEPVLTDWDKIYEELETADKVRFEAFKKIKLEELREAELERLVAEKLDELVNEELDKLIEQEVERLAGEKFEELKLAYIIGLDLEDLTSDELTGEDEEESLLTEDGEAVLIISDDAKVQEDSVEESETADSSNESETEKYSDTEESDGTSKEAEESSESSDEGSTSEEVIIIFSDENG